MAIDKIGSKALVDCSVAAVDIAPGTITDTQLAGSISNAKLANSSVTINSTAIALGASANIQTLDWQAVVVSDGSTVTTMAAGKGYFINNTSAAGIVKLPTSANRGDTIAIKDYAGNFGTNKLSIQRNGHNIQGLANNGLIGTNRASVTLVYIDSTKGWLYQNESNVGDLQNAGFTSATGGTVTESGDFKIHTFTGDGNFVVSQAGFGPAQLTKVDYLVLAGGGGGGSGDGAPGGSNPQGGGGGAGGYRESKDSDIASPHTASPIAATTGITISATTFPITVGGGGAGAPQAANPASSPHGTSAAGSNGSNSVFSTITSAGGGFGGNAVNPRGGGPGGSGGGAAGRSGNYTGGGGAGNTPPVSPAQGQSGGTSSPNPCGANKRGAGGGGAGTAGVASGTGGTDGIGGDGVASSITGSSVNRAGGGGGDGNPGRVNNPTDFGGGGTGAATANKGGGGSGRRNAGGESGSKGIVIIRYKFQ